MQTLEMARRVRHDLIKHLDIPAEGQILTADEIRVLIRRIFDSGSGICALACVLGFRMRREEGWSERLNTAFVEIEKACAALKRHESGLKKLMLCGGVPEVALIQDLRALTESVHGFEVACEPSCAGMTDTQDDAWSALEFFGLTPETKALSGEKGQSVAGKYAEPPSTKALKSTDKAAKLENFSEVSVLSSKNGIDARGETVEKPRVLVVDDRLVLVDRLQAHPTFRERFLWARRCGKTEYECTECPKRDSCEFKRARTYQDTVEALRFARMHARRLDAVLLDVRFDDLRPDELLWLPDMPAFNTEEKVKALQGLVIARHLRRMPEFRHIPIMLMTSLSRLPDGAASLLEGLEGLQFVDDEDSLDALATRLESVIRMGREATVVQGYFWGSSPRIQLIRRQLEIMSQGPRTLLITGPSGSGKSSLVEHIILPMSGRKKLVTLDLSAIPDTLVESELFGHVKGAYSGATQDRAGMIEEADGGILFLDEIGNLSMENQRKLLLFLQDKMLRRVGAAHETRRRVDVKVVVATHLDLEQEIAANRFRFDLYMRFGPAMRIALPALVERRDDLPALVETLVQKMMHGEDMMPHVMDMQRRCGGGSHIKVEFQNIGTVTSNDICIRFVPATRDLFLSYEWPGNTRELESVLDTLILRALYDLKVSNSKSRIVEIDHYYALTLLGGIDKVQAAHQAQAALSDGTSFCEIGEMADFGELRQTLERRYLCQMFELCDGDLQLMGKKMFGDESKSVKQKILIRMNQLGISIKKLRR